MKTALAQINIRFEDKTANEDTVRKYIKEAADNSADIVFFPEMTFTGFTMDVQKNGDLNGETIDKIRQMSYSYNVAVGFGWIKRAGEKGENHYTVISPRGEILADYVKMHPFSYSSEDKYYNAGNSLSSFTYLGKRISVFICYDLRFPEIFQAASEESEIIAVAANWPERRREHWKALLKARGIENQSWILGVNCFGDQQELHYSGDSSIIKPDGTIASEINNAEGIIYAEIGDEVKDVRNGFPVKHDRRTELYKKLYKGCDDYEL